MRRRNIHSLMVALSGNDLGIVTSTDIRDKIAGIERDPKTTLVREIMTSPVITAKPEMTLKDCSLKMKEKGVHHLPVADERGMNRRHDIGERHLRGHRKKWLGGALAHPVTELQARWRRPPGFFLAFILLPPQPQAVLTITLCNNTRTVIRVIASMRQASRILSLSPDWKAARE